MGGLLGYRTDPAKPVAAPRGAFLLSAFFIDAGWPGFSGPGNFIGPRTCLGPPAIESPLTAPTVWVLDLAITCPSSCWQRDCPSVCLWAETPCRRRHRPPV